MLLCCIQFYYAKLLLRRPQAPRKQVMKIIYINDGAHEFPGKGILLLSAKAQFVILQSSCFDHFIC